MSVPRIVLFASPDEVLPVAEVLEANDDLELAAIVSQPAKPKGRGLRLVQSALARFAAHTGVPFRTPQKLTAAEELRALQNLHAEVFLVFAYGRLLPASVLHVPHAGVVNIHPSLLPKYRGASPIPAAILAGDAETGISYMLLDEGMDTGPLLKQTKIPIGQNETRRSLFAKVVAHAAGEIVGVLKSYVSGVLQPVPQPTQGVSETAPLTKRDGELDFTKTAVELWRMVRAYEGWPSTFTFWNRRRLTVHSAAPIPASGAAPGAVFQSENKPAVQTADGALLLREVQLEGRKRLAAEDFLRGASGFIGARLPS